MPQNRRDELLAYITAQGWQWQPGTAIPYGEQFVVSAPGHRATVDYYPKRGRMVVGGPASPLTTALRSWIAGADQSAASNPPADPGSPSIPIPHIGMDESGKGDWFGPLVVAAVFVDAPTSAVLRAAGVRDSKTIPAPVMRQLTAAIEQRVPAAHRHVLILWPEVYNALYAEHGNINVLLGTAYAQAAAPVVQATGAQTIVCDQFSARADRLETAFAAKRLPRPHQQPHAEAASIAVAAASILATSAFRAAIEELGQTLGRPLPKGSSDGAVLEATARQILREHGRDGLGRAAKLHFKPLQALLAAPTL